MGKPINRWHGSLNKRGKIILNFEKWLLDQQNREDLIGDLARHPHMQNFKPKPARRKPNEHKNWVEVVISLAKTGYIAVFNDAWQEYLLAKEAGENSLD